MWKSKRVEHIPNGVPIDVFYPLERSFARSALDLPLGNLTLMVAAETVTDPRKGVAVLAASLKNIAIRPVTVVTVGRGRLAIDLPGVNVRNLGHMSNERLLMLAYNAADLLVHPALADNLPNVVMEAMSCGTPAVAFPVGGLPDMVRPGLTGWLAPDVTAESLSRTIASALNVISDGVTLRDSCRATCVNEYSLEQQSAKYIQLMRGEVGVTY